MTHWQRGYVPKSNRRKVNTKMRVNTTHHVRQCFCDFAQVHLVVLNDIENQSTKYYYAVNVECKSLITLTKKYRQPLLRFLTAAQR